MNTEVMKAFSGKLESMKDWPDKQLIMDMTKLAENFYNPENAHGIVNIIIGKLMNHNTNSTYKLPMFYLLDSIMKNVGGSFPELVSKSLSAYSGDCFRDLHGKDIEKTRFLFTTWEERQLIPLDLLVSLKGQLSVLESSQVRGRSLAQQSSVAPASNFTTLSLQHLQHQKPPVFQRLPQLEYERPEQRGYVNNNARFVERAPIFEHEQQQKQVPQRGEVAVRQHQVQQSSVSAARANIAPGLTLPAKVAATPASLVAPSIGSVGIVGGAGAISSTAVGNSIVDRSSAVFADLVQNEMVAMLNQMYAEMNVSNPMTLDELAAANPSLFLQIRTAASEAAYKILMEKQQKHAARQREIQLQQQLLEQQRLQQMPLLPPYLNTAAEMAAFPSGREGESAGGRKRSSDALAGFTRYPGDRDRDIRGQDSFEASDAVGYRNRFVERGGGRYLDDGGADRLGSTQRRGKRGAGGRGGAAGRRGETREQDEFYEQYPPHDRGGAGGGAGAGRRGSPVLHGDTDFQRHENDTEGSGVIDRGFIADPRRPAAAAMGAGDSAAIAPALPMVQEPATGQHHAILPLTPVSAAQAAATATASVFKQGYICEVTVDVDITRTRRLAEVLRNDFPVQKEIVKKESTERAAGTAEAVVDGGAAPMDIVDTMAKGGGGQGGAMAESKLPDEAYAGTITEREAFDRAASRAFARLSFLLDEVEIPPRLPAILSGPLPLEPVTKAQQRAVGNKENSPPRPVKKLPVPPFRAEDLNNSPAKGLLKLYKELPFQFHEDGTRFRTLAELMAHTDAHLEKKKQWSKKRQQEQLRASMGMGVSAGGSSSSGSGSALSLLGDGAQRRGWFCRCDQWETDFNAFDSQGKRIPQQQLMLERGAAAGGGGGSSSGSGGGGHTVDMGVGAGARDEEYVVPADEHFTRCPISKELFESVWDDEEGEFMYRNAVKVLVTEAADKALFEEYAQPVVVVGAGAVSPTTDALLETLSTVRYLIVHKSLVLDRWLEMGKAASLADACLRYESMDIGSLPITGDAASAGIAEREVGPSGLEEAEGGGGITRKSKSKAANLAEKLRLAAGDDDEDDVFVLLEFTSFAQ